MSDSREAMRAFDPDEFMREWGAWAKWSDASAMVEEAYNRGLRAALEARAEPAAVEDWMRQQGLDPALEPTDRTQWIRDAFAAGKAAMRTASPAAATQGDAKDAARFRWYFSDAPEGDWLATYLDSRKVGWTMDQWRAAIDAAIGAESEQATEDGRHG